MDVSSVGVANSAQYLQKAQTKLEGPFDPAKQQDQAARVAAQVIAQAPPPPPPPSAAAEVSKQGVGRVFDIKV
ncbi:hypothetical protein [Magnetospirillum sp. SS-4]|uniref:hypothetical protein n=1 Tax=Magnetospirillum sp. SS-4 TaxID=2681465 RepID=UPI00137DA7B7|nr:hypothetical protein [Magnetospirillum sp. SS-4]CAA7625202.1 conserved hypothetical protein [Magnetospirillum sp. SS-4]